VGIEETAHPPVETNELYPWFIPEGGFDGKCDFETIGNIREGKSVTARLSSRIGFVGGQLWYGVGGGIPRKHYQSRLSGCQRSGTIN
jgi:hypothetical protein